ncbi:MAG: hypothetical protein MZW92_76175 [Comamonadaceae bacterium]|nr:hypothetical protein [Comamonadaceae bacterium]
MAGLPLVRRRGRRRAGGQERQRRPGRGRLRAQRRVPRRTQLRAWRTWSRAACRSFWWPSSNSSARAGTGSTRRWPPAPRPTACHTMR